MYPLTGKVAEHVGSVQASTLLAERIIFKLHRLGKMEDTECPYSLWRTGRSDYAQIPLSLSDGVSPCLLPANLLDVPRCSGEAL